MASSKFPNWSRVMMSSVDPVFVSTPSAMCQPAGRLCDLYPRHALVFVPSNSGRHPAAVWSAVKPPVPVVVVLVLLADCELLPIGAHAANARAISERFVDRASAAVNMALL